MRTTASGRNGMNEVKVMKEIYEVPELEIVEFESSDVICTSFLMGDDEGEWFSIW